jgi:hypothetical protein
MPRDQHVTCAWIADLSTKGTPASLSTLDKDDTRTLKRRTRRVKAEMSMDRLRDTKVNAHKRTEVTHLWTPRLADLPFQSRGIRGARSYSDGLDGLYEKMSCVPLYLLVKRRSRRMVRGP